IRKEEEFPAAPPPDETFSHSRPRPMRTHGKSGMIRHDVTNERDTAARFPPKQYRSALFDVPARRLPVGRYPQQSNSNTTQRSPLSRSVSSFVQVAIDYNRTPFQSSTQEALMTQRIIASFAAFAVIFTAAAVSSSAQTAGASS